MLKTGRRTSVSCQLAPKGSLPALYQHVNAAVVSFPVFISSSSSRWIAWQNFRLKLLNGAVKSAVAHIACIWLVSWLSSIHCVPTVAVWSCRQMQCHGVCGKMSELQLCNSCRCRPHCPCMHSHHWTACFCSLINWKYFAKKWNLSTLVFKWCSAGELMQKRKSKTYFFANILLLVFIIYKLLGAITSKEFNKHRACTFIMLLISGMKSRMLFGLGFFSLPLSFPSPPPLLPLLPLPSPPPPSPLESFLLTLATSPPVKSQEKCCVIHQSIPCVPCALVFVCACGSGLLDRSCFCSLILLI